ncbi:MAG: BatD family protein [Desulfotalea sp.]
MKKIALLTFILALFTTISLASEVSVKVGMRKTSFSITQGGVMLVEIQGSRSAEIILPDVNGITFQGAGSSQNVQFINGDFSATIVKSYVIVAEKEGSYNIPKIEVKVDDESYYSKPFTFRVNADKTAQTKDIRGNEIAFIDLQVEKSAYPGEKLDLVVNAYFNNNYNIKVNSGPQLTYNNGLVISSSSDKPIQTQESRGTTTYSKVMWHLSISALKSGSYPVEVQIPAIITTKSQRRNQFNDPFFNSLFQDNKRESFVVKSDIVDVEILKLPEENMPDNFTGAIGKFDIVVSADSAQAEIGQPVTLINTIVGQGNFENVSPPVMNENKNWKIYPAKPISDQNEKNQKVFEQVVIAKKQTSTIPPLHFSYFDPETKEYVVIESEPIKIEVLANGLDAVNQDKKEPTIEEPKKVHDLTNTKSITPRKQPDDIIDQYPSDLSAKQTKPIFMQAWFQVIIFVCLLLMAVLFSYSLYSYLQKKNYKKIAEKNRLKLLEKQLLDIAEKQGDDKILRTKVCIQEQLSLKLGLEARAISGATIREKLPHSELSNIMDKINDFSLVGKPISNDEIVTYLEQIKKELS